MLNDPTNTSPFPAGNSSKPRPWVAASAAAAANLSRGGPRPGEATIQRGHNRSRRPRRWGRGELSRSGQESWRRRNNRWRCRPLPEQAMRGKESFGVLEDKCFSGFDAYRKVLEIPGVNYCILATPPGFRASHFRACVEAGKNVFTESLSRWMGPAPDGCMKRRRWPHRSISRSLPAPQRRPPGELIETIKRIHDGEIWLTVGCPRGTGSTATDMAPCDKGETDLERQIRNWYHYIWLSGDHICEQHVHNWTWPTGS